MNLTWHIAKKDLRRFWGPLALLPAIAVIRFGVGMSLMESREPDRIWFGHMAVYADVLWGIGLFVTFMLVAAVVQEDSVAGPAFWQTRPISGSRLLAAKALGLFLMFGLLPVLVSLPWWVYNGFGSSEIGRAALETLAVQMGVALLALPWAAVTGHYGRFLLWTLVAAMAGVTAMILFAGHDFGARGDASALTTATRFFAIVLVLGTGCGAVAVHQFVTRKTTRSIALIALTALSIAGIARWWAWDGSALIAPRPAAPHGLARDIRISFQDAYALTTPALKSTVVEVNLLAGPVPAHYVLSGLFSGQELRWADGSVTQQANYEMWGHVAPSMRDAYDKLGLVPEPGAESRRLQIMRSFLVRLPELDPKLPAKIATSFPLGLSSENMKRLLAEKPEYDGMFWFRLLQPGLVGEKPAREGSVVEKGPSKVRVVAVDHDETRKVAWLYLMERFPEYAWRSLLSVLQLAPWRLEQVYGIVNRERTYATDALNETRDRALIADVAIILRKEGFRGRDQWNPTARRWEKEATDLDGATLAVVDYSEVEQFQLPLKVDRLALAYSGVPKHAIIGSCTVAGDVNKPGSIDLVSGTTLLSVLRAAGGVSDGADLSAVVITRAAPDGTPSRIIVNLDAWLASENSNVQIPIVQPGDIIAVPAKKVEAAP